MLKKSKADDKCSLKCGAERVNVYMVDSLFQIVVLYNALNGVIDAPVTTFNSEAIYECNTGYMLEGNGVRWCQIGGIWSGSDPTCVFTDKLILACL